VPFIRKPAIDREAMGKCTGRDSPGCLGTARDEGSVEEPGRLGSVGLVTQPCTGTNNRMGAESIVGGVHSSEEAG
jgi:hypothetical protein